MEHNKRFFKKRVYFLFIIVSCVFILNCSNYTSDNADDYNNHEKTIVCLGDSLTAGYGATTPGLDDKSKSYPVFLQNMVTIPVINAGVSGNTTSQGLSRVDTEVISKNPIIVIINLGANDLFRGIFLSATQDNLQTIINKLNNGYRKIYLTKFYTEAIAREMASTIGISDYSLQTNIINQYDNMYNSLALSENVILIDDIWNGVWGIHMSDAIHPNALGYEIMANNYFNILQPYLEENNLILGSYYGKRGILFFRNRK